MKNLKIKTKLIILVSAMLAFLVALNIISFVVLMQMNDSTKVIANQWMNAIVQVEDLNANIKEFRLQEYKHVSSTTTTGKQDSEALMATLKSTVENKLSACSQTAQSDKDKEIVSNIKTGWTAYLGIHDNAITLSNAKETTDALRVMANDSYTQYKNLHTLCDSLVKYDQDAITQASNNATSVYSNAQKLMFCSDVIIFVVCLAFAIYTIEGISRPITKIDGAARKIADGKLDVSVDYQSTNELGMLAANFNRTAAQLKNYGNYLQEITNVLNEIADGNLTFQLTYDYEGEFAPVKKALDHLSDSLNQTMGQINLAADQVAGGAGQVSSGAQDLSQGTTEQASSAEELAATINDISEHVKDNASYAHEASGKVQDMSEKMRESNQQMQEMITAMHDISNSSAKIGKIIKAIEDIASQTNILALNAAIEAARAGAAGRGFAVVADEVRNLAGKSAEASKSTSQLIQTSLTAVKHGSEIAGETAQSLTEVVTGTEEVTDGIRRIADASNEQATAIEQVTQGVGQISNVIQTNTATAEESAAASEELSGQAQLLKNLVSKFRLKGNADAALQQNSNTVPSTVDSAPPSSATDDADEDSFEDISSYSAPSTYSVHDKY
ncbi:methyl-accepting chemotaxis protein [Caproicibacterium amylolyticum]|uniref:MCP four helix bundle domain-containing protein n=1 Tax=Caproicibacterium amylolyticum TaxID=2766537 RepID=A0A7G9WFL7_9FIRM|nr:methyl-accepting chemotaxis protein [Caproicibacterium amylolyticum]QNO17479.1 MCP four helix bundle domain-containing protein [Caproicibacterium amylolyticum]